MAKKKKSCKKHHIIIEVDPKVRNKFRKYCRGQEVTMKLGLTTLMTSAVRRNVKIRHKMGI